MSGLDISKDWYNSAGTLFNMSIARLRVCWMVKVGCGICSSYSDCSCGMTLACFSCCSALMAIFWAWFLSRPVDSVNTISFQYIPINKLSRVCFCSRHCDELSKFPFKSEEFIFSAVEWAVGRQPSAVSPPQNCLSWRESHYPRPHPFYWGSLNPEIGQNSTERPCPLTPSGLPDKMHSAQII